MGCSFTTTERLGAPGVAAHTRDGHAVAQIAAGHP